MYCNFNGLLDMTSWISKKEQKIDDFFKFGVARVATDIPELHEICIEPRQFF